MLGAAPLTRRTIGVALSVHTAFLILRDEGTYRGVKLGGFSDRLPSARVPRSAARLHQSVLTLTMSVGIVQKFSRVFSSTGPLAQLVRNGLFFGVCLIGCSTANVKSQPLTPAQRPQVNERQGMGTFEASKRTHWDFFDVVGTRTPIALSLPTTGNWEFDDQHTPWWVASNATLELKLEAKLWPERRQVTKQECLTDLSRWRSEARPGARANQVRTEGASIPQGFDSQLTVTTSKASGSENEGIVVLLVGAEVARCFGFVATLSPAKPLPRDELLARTALVTEGVIPKIQLRTIEQRIEPQAR